MRFVRIRDGVSQLCLPRACRLAPKTLLLCLRNSVSPLARRRKEISVCRKTRLSFWRRARAPACTRDRPKVLQTILGEPMLAYVRAALRPVFAEDVWMVVGHRAQMVEAAFPDARLVFQTEQLGTGHALMQALPR